MSFATPRRRRLRVLSARVAVIALAFLTLGGAVVGVAFASPEDEVKQAESRLDNITQQYRASQVQLERAKSALNDAATALAEAELAYQSTVQEIVATRAEIERATARLEQIQAQLEERARQGFIAGTTSSQLSFILDSSSFTDLSDRLEFLGQLGAEDAQLAADVANERARLEMRRADLERIQSRQADLLAKRQARRDDMQQAFAAADRARTRLADLRDQAVTLLAKKKKELRQWKAQQAAAAETLTGGGGASFNGPGPFQACPVDGAGLSDSFGAPRDGGARLHLGIDIFGEYGVPVRAAFDGVASNSSNSTGGFAITVTSNQGKGYVYNAHLSKIVKLGPVQAGDIIGLNGNSGNAAGTPPHDHFEWHPPSPPSGVPSSGYGYSVIEDAVNPYPFLTGVC